MILHLFRKKRKPADTMRPDPLSRINRLRQLSPERRRRYLAMMAEIEAGL